MNNNESIEMYLETVYLLETEHGHAHSVEIAKKLGVSKPSVTKAMNVLKSRGLITKETYGTITLTQRGKKISKEIYKNHQLITRFLEKSLNLNEDEASKNACKIEHVISNEMMTAIAKYLAENHIDTAR